MCFVQCKYVGSSERGSVILFYLQLLNFKPETLSSFLVLDRLSVVSISSLRTDAGQQSIPSHTVSYPVSFVSYNYLLSVSLLVDPSQYLLVDHPILLFNLQFSSSTLISKHSRCLVRLSLDLTSPLRIKRQVKYFSWQMNDIDFYL